MKAGFAAALVLLSGASGIHAENTYYRAPSVQGNNLVFTVEGDLWRVALAGGTAQRLTSNAGEEIEASISADGRRIAFVGGYDANPEVYVMPISGGSPKRLSFDGGGVHVVGWTPDNEVLFSSTAVTNRSARPKSRSSRATTRAARWRKSGVPRPMAAPKRSAWQPM